MLSFVNLSILSSLFSNTPSAIHAGLNITLSPFFEFSFAKVNASLISKACFNSTFFNESKKRSLVNAADSWAVFCNRADPIHSAGDLQYAITAIYLGFLGYAEGFEEANYGLKVYLQGIVERVMSTIETVSSGSNKDSTMAFRRHLIIRGVLADTINEVKSATVVPVGKDADNYLLAHADQSNLSIYNENGKLVFLNSD